MGVLFLIVVVIIVIGLPALYLFGVVKLFRRAWRNTPSSATGQRMATGAALLFGLCAPYLAYKAFELKHVLALVPAPLHSMWIDYRLEESWGIGMPGDNETGFIVYPMTSDSAEWARAQGAKLEQALDGRGAPRWYPTPVDLDIEDGDRRWAQRERSSRHPPDLVDYLGVYGFSIDANPEWIARANRAIRNQGSFYAYDRGGRVTIVDPANGLIYVAYAG